MQLFLKGNCLQSSVLLWCENGGCESCVYGIAKDQLAEAEME